MLRQKLSRKKNQPQNGANVLNDKMRKNSPSEYINKQLRRSRQAWRKFVKRKPGQTHF